MSIIYHISDLHLGRNFHGYSLINDQKKALDFILKSIANEKPDALLIAGDIYDRAVPPTEAVSLFNDFLENLAESKTETVIIAGNHDSPERLGFGSHLLKKSGIHISTNFENITKPLIINNVEIFSLPFLDTTQLRYQFKTSESSFAELASKAINSISEKVDSKRFSILMSHEFVGTTSVTSESERVTIGGAHILEAELYKKFNYTALGHLHRPQQCKDLPIYYSGSILPYSFAETDHIKSFNRIEIDDELNSKVEKVPIKGYREFSIIEDDWDSIFAEEKYNKYKEHYVSIRLTDGAFHTDMAMQLRERFPYLMEVRQLVLEQNMQFPDLISSIENSPLELFDLFSTQFEWKDDNYKEEIAKLFEEKVKTVQLKERT